MKISKHHEITTERRIKMSRVLGTALILASFCLVFGFSSQAFGGEWSLNQSGQITTNDKVGIGIGTTEEPGTNLHVRYSDSGHTPTNVGGLFVESGGISDSSYIFQTATTGGGKSFSITNTGKVGIGTTSPKAKIHVSGDGSDGIVLIERNGKSLALNPNYGGKNKFAHISTYTGSDMGLKLDVNEQTRLTITTDGDVGIGTEGPSEKLDVFGTTRTTVLEITGGGDLAEPFDIAGSEAIKPGMVVAIDPEHPGQLRIADKAYDRTVAGCVSGAKGINPGLTMRQEGSAVDGSLPVALSGRVYCLAEASSGAIQPGDLLTTSDIPGHAIRVTNYAKAQGAIFGKAMTSLDQGRGLVLVLVTLQ